MNPSTFKKIIALYIVIFSAITLWGFLRIVGFISPTPEFDAFLTVIGLLLIADLVYYNKLVKK